MSANETIILAVGQHNHDIIVRIDQNGLAQSQFAGSPVVELQLLGVSDPDSVMDELAVDLYPWITRSRKNLAKPPS
jgi:hypothetical protein